MEVVASKRVGNGVFGLSGVKGGAILAAAIAGIGLALPRAAHATAYTWTADPATSVDWSVAGNWDANGSMPSTSTTADTLKFFSNITTVLSAGTFTYTNVPATLSMNNLTLNGLGNTTSTATATTINIGSSSSTWTLGGTSPTVTLNASKGSGGTAAGLSININAKIALGADVTFGGGGTAAMTFAGVISGAHALTFNGAGDVTINAANTYSLGTTVGGTERVLVKNATGLGTGSVTVSSGEVYVPSGTALTNAFFLNGLGNTARDTQNRGALRLDAGSSQSGTITLQSNSAIGNSSGTGTFNGKITGAFSLGVNLQGSSGYGTVVLTNTTNNWTGGLTFGNATSANSLITGSILQLGASEVIPNGASAGNVTFNAGTFNMNGFSETMNGLSGQAVNGTTFLGVTIDNKSATSASVLTLGDNNATGAFNGNIQSSAAGGLSIVKIGSGTQTFGGANTYAGTTTVNAGTLLITGTHTGAGNYSVTGSASGSATLGGNGGSITLASGSSVTASSPSAANPGIIAPGGTLTITGGNGVIFGNNSQLLINLNGSSSDHLAVGGNLDLSSALDSVSFSGTTDGVTNYVIATYGGTLTGTFNQQSNVPAGYTLDYSTPGQIVLAVPEPASLGLVALGAGGLLVRRRRACRA